MATKYVVDDEIVSDTKRKLVRSVAHQLGDYALLTGLGIWVSSALVLILIAVRLLSWEGSGRFLITAIPSWFILSIAALRYLQPQIIDVPWDNFAIIERWNWFHRASGKGPRIIFNRFEKVVAIKTVKSKGYRRSLNCHTADGLQVTLTIEFKPKPMPECPIEVAYYRLMNMESKVDQFTLDTVPQIVSGMTFESIKADQGKLQEEIEVRTGPDLWKYLHIWRDVVVHPVQEPESVRMLEQSVYEAQLKLRIAQQEAQGQAALAIAPTALLLETMRQAFPTVPEQLIMALADRFWQNKAIEAGASGAGNLVLLDLKDGGMSDLLKALMAARAVSDIASRVVDTTASAA